MKTIGLIILIVACFTPVAAAWSWVYFGMTTPVFVATLITFLTLLFIGAILYGKGVVDTSKR
jgi:hypothetical protein